MKANAEAAKVTARLEATENARMNGACDGPYPPLVCTDAPAAAGLSPLAARRVELWQWAHAAVVVLVKP